MLLILASTQALANRRAAVGYAVSQPLVIDGSLEDWNPGMYGITPPISLSAATSTVEEGRIDGDADHSAEIYAAFGPTELYVAAIVTDDHVVAQYTGPDIWLGDMFEILIARPKGGYFHIGVAPQGSTHVFSPPPDECKPPPNPDPKGQKKSASPPCLEKSVRAAARIQPPGYTVELAIPYRVFGASGREKSLRLNFAARDADPGKSPSAHRTWSGYRHNALASFGWLYKEQSPLPPTAWPRCSFSPAVEVGQPLQAAGRQLLAGTHPVRLRMVNFQSANLNWTEFWTRFDSEQITRDLARASRLGINAVRLFVFFEEFGGAEPKMEMVNRLEAVIQQAASLGMVSVVSFFPFKKEFRPERWPEMESHLRKIVARFRGSPAIAMWDLMNEPDHAWALPDGGTTATAVAAWAKHMYAAVKEADPTHLVTVGLAGHFAVGSGPIRAEESLPFVDVRSIHWYFDLPKLPAALARAKESLQTPVVLQEFGATGLFFDEAEASQQYAEICKQADREELAGVGAWELYDHPVGSIAWYKQPWKEAAENYFGLLRSDGSPKAQAAVFCNCLKVPKLSISHPEVVP